MGLDAKIRDLVRRMRAVALARRLSAYLLWALGLAILLAALDKLVYLGGNIWLAAGVLAGVALLAALAGTAVGRHRRRLRRDIAAAAAADRALGLGDRLTSALELRRNGGPWADAVVHDAERHSRDLRSSEVFPLEPTISARLLIPAVILLGLISILPPADLLGRMEREVERQVAAETDALHNSSAIAAAFRSLPAGRWARPETERPENSIGRLRLNLVRIEKDLAAAASPRKHQLELGHRLRQLAGLMKEHGADVGLVEAIKKAAEALETDDKEAAMLLRAAQQKLARLEEALRGPDEMGRYAKALAEKKAAEFRAVGTSDLSAALRRETTGEPDGDLVELAPTAGEPPQPSVPRGIVYSPRATGSTPAPAALDYERAVRSAHAQIESKKIPPGYARLVRDYFDSIRPAAK